MQVQMTLKCSCAEHKLLLISAARIVLGLVPAALLDACRPDGLLGPDVAAEPAAAAPVAAHVGGGAGRGHEGHFVLPVSDARAAGLQQRQVRVLRAGQELRRDRRRRGVRVRAAAARRQAEAAKAARQEQALPHLQCKEQMTRVE